MNYNKLNHHLAATGFGPVNLEAMEHHLNLFSAMCHHLADARGWWDEAKLAERNGDSRYVMALVCEKHDLCHSELSEALEGLRKRKKDDHLPNLPNAEVEMCDAAIRIADLMRFLNYNLGTTSLRKLLYNIEREDHNREHREGENGKLF